MSQVKSRLIFMSPVKSQMISMSKVKSQLIFMSKVKSQMIFMSKVKVMSRLETRPRAEGIVVQCERSSTDFSTCSWHSETSAGFALKPAGRFALKPAGRFALKPTGCYALKPAGVYGQDGRSASVYGQDGRSASVYGQDGLTRRGLPGGGHSVAPSGRGTFCHESSQFRTTLPRILLAYHLHSLHQSPIATYS
ncbi:hypothetical protein DPX16_17327 [Anabarilius grahami]|uniref:Uncharacterized protein n=1 Tax=Anabarilius grahami TaxID=495550 RepID=A0A3N0XYM9_ANAGA|nr:hypothetical protein DPX16_17327 [Anabarilius grahami]